MKNRAQALSKGLTRVVAYNANRDIWAHISLLLSDHREENSSWTLFARCSSRAFQADLEPLRNHIRYSGDDHIQKRMLRILMRVKLGSQSDLFPILPNSQQRVDAHLSPGERADTVVQKPNEVAEDERGVRRATQHESYADG
jgi:hypothetical protein